MSVAPPIAEEKLHSLFAHADELGLKLELTDGAITWEASPGVLHQEIVFGVQSSLVQDNTEGTGYGCHQYADIEIALPDGTVKRPDISVWCRRPVEDEGFVHSIPEAVIEIVSRGYEAKDLVQGPPIYLRNGVKDVIVFDRVKGEVHHWNPNGKRVVPSPAVFELACGCRVTV